MWTIFALIAQTLLHSWFLNEKKLCFMTVTPLHRTIIQGYLFTILNLSDSFWWVIFGWARSPSVQLVIFNLRLSESFISKTPPDLISPLCAVAMNWTATTISRLLVERLLVTTTASCCWSKSIFSSRGIFPVGTRRASENTAIIIWIINQSSRVVLNFRDQDYRAGF